MYNKTYKTSASATSSRYCIDLMGPAEGKTGDQIIARVDTQDLYDNGWKAAYNSVNGKQYMADSVLYDYFPQKTYSKLQTYIKVAKPSSSVGGSYDSITYTVEGGSGTAVIKYGTTIVAKATHDYIYTQAQYNAAKAEIPSGCSNTVDTQNAVNVLYSKKQTDYSSGELVSNIIYFKTNAPTPKEGGQGLYLFYTSANNAVVSLKDGNTNKSNIVLKKALPETTSSGDSCNHSVVSGGKWAFSQGSTPNSSGYYTHMLWISSKSKTVSGLTDGKSYTLYK